MDDALIPFHEDPDLPRLVRKHFKGDQVFPVCDILFHVVPAYMEGENGHIFTVLVNDIPVFEDCDLKPLSNLFGCRDRASLLHHPYDGRHDLNSRSTVNTVHKFP